MSQTKISVHPQIKKIIQNLDLDLSLELSRYEHSSIHDSALIPQSFTEDNPLYPNTSPPALVYQSVVVEKDHLEEEVIPVASHSINDQTSILDRILTPWGIFGIIIFFAANLFIFFNLDSKNLSEISQNNQNPTNIVNPETNSSPEQILPENNKNVTSLPAPEKITIPETLPVVKENSPPQIPSPYPDLQTALFTEINKQQSSLTKLPAQPKITSPTNKVTTTTPQAKKEQKSPTPTKYYLVSNYKNMNEFNRIKKIVPAAFITNIDRQMKIQLGVFENEKKAQKKAQQLQNKGIDNYLYNPANAEPGT